MNTDQRSPRETAALLMAWLEEKGARFRLRVDGSLDVNCDAIDVDDIGGPEVQDMIARQILGLGPAIKTLLAEQQISH
jgi:hypothetical protein